ncbi:hypothetical protein ACO0QE_004084 [Hanseniaspora vineae]
MTKPANSAQSETAQWKQSISNENECDFDQVYHYSDNSNEHPLLERRPSMLYSEDGEDGEEEDFDDEDNFHNRHSELAQDYGRGINYSKTQGMLHSHNEFMHHFNTVEKFKPHPIYSGDQKKVQQLKHPLETLKESKVKSAFAAKSLDDLDMVGLSTDFDREMYKGYLDEDVEQELQKLIKMILNLKDKYNGNGNTTSIYDLVDRVDPNSAALSLIETDSNTVRKPEIKKITEFIKDYDRVSEFIDEFCQGYYKTYVTKKNNYLLNKFELYTNLCSNLEIQQTKMIPHKDFYNVLKVDPDLLINGCFSIHQLNNFVMEKLRTESKKIVVELDGQRKTLGELFKTGDSETSSYEHVVIDDDFLEWYQYQYLPNHSGSLQKVMFLDDQDMDKNTATKLFYFKVAKVFLEFDNYVEGQYLFELMERCVFKRKSSHQLYQMSIDFQFDMVEDEKTGKLYNQWCEKFYKFNEKFTNHHHSNIEWNVRVHRNYTHLYEQGMVSNFKDFLNEIEHLIENASKVNCSIKHIDVIYRDSDPYLWKFFSCTAVTHPAEWKISDNPPLAYYMFYVHQLLRQNTINSESDNACENNGKLCSNISLRNNCGTQKSMGKLSQFTMLGDSIYKESLIANILLANSNQITSAEPIAQTAIFQYLYYIFQITCIVSPLSTVSKYYGGSDVHDYNKSNDTLYHATNFSTASIDKPSQFKSHSSSTISMKNRDLNYSRASNFFYRGNPFMDMHKMGMRVVLSSHSIVFNNSYTRDPLLEEYSVAASIYLINSCDMCELALNSTTDHGDYEYENESLDHPFEDNAEEEKHNYKDDVYKHNVAPVRRQYRITTWQTEMNNLKLLP